MIFRMYTIISKSQTNLQPNFKKVSCLRSFFVSALLLLLVVSCRKGSDDFLIWQKSQGPGIAFFISSTPDSGVISTGTLNNKAYLSKLSKSKDPEMEYTSESDGLFSSVWYNGSFIIAAGSSEGKMLLTRLDNQGQQIWSTTINTGFTVDVTTLLNTGGGNMLAVGSASADSSYEGTTGVLFVRFDEDGGISLNKGVTENSFIAANNAASDGSGNVYLSLTRKTGGSTGKMSVAKYNSDFNKIWETELYNNVNFGASGRGILVDNNSNIFVTGKTEVSKETGTLDESFLASLSGSGIVRWKKYLENSNCGISLIMNETGSLYLLNRNCFFINVVNPEDGSDEGRLRTFDACDPYSTDAFGMYFDTDPDGKILVAGARGGNYYLALKDPERQ